MKKKLEKETTFCDICGEEQRYCYVCLNCKMDFCYECARKKGVLYKSNVVYNSGCGDGFYCEKCDAELTKTNDMLNGAYRKILSLRNEHKSWNKEFQKRAYNAEAVLVKLRDMKKEVIE
jgi:peptide methionine sulfoxide reductase MsrB